MSIYGSNSTRSSWEFDVIFEAYNRIRNSDDPTTINDLAKGVLYGRHVCMYDSWVDHATSVVYPAGIYQRTESDNFEDAFIYIGPTAPSLEGVEVFITPQGTQAAGYNTGSFEFDPNTGTTKLKLRLGSVQDLSALQIDQAAILGLMQEQDDSVRIFTWPEAEAAEDNLNGNPNPSTFNGFHLAGQGVVFRVVQSETSNEKTLIMKAFPSWKPFTEIIPQSNNEGYSSGIIPSGGSGISGTSIEYDPNTDMVTIG